MCSKISGDKEFDSDYLGGVRVVSLEEETMGTGEKSVGDSNHKLGSVVDAWRANALNTLLYVAAVIFIPVIILWITRYNSPREILAATWLYLGIYLVIFCLTIFRQVDYRIRAWILIFLGYGTGIQALILGGLAGDGRIYLMVLPMLAVILINARAALLITGMLVISYVIVAITASQGWLQEQLIIFENPLDLATWVSIGIVWAACLSLVSVLQWRFNQFLEATALENAKLFNQNRTIIAELEQRVDERTQELQKTNIEIQLREKNLQEAQRIGRIGSWEWDIVNDTKKWSKESYRIAERSPDQFGCKQSDFLSIVHPDDLDMIIRETQEALERGKPYDVIYRQVLPDQSIKHIHTLAEVICDEGGTPILMRGTMHDISERVQAEEDLLGAKAEAERANDAKTEFLSRMSHELRAPMNLVLGFAELLEMDQKNPLTADQQKNVRHILDEGEHLLKIIDEILDISSIEAGRLGILIAPIDIRALLEELLASTSQMAADHEVQVELTTHDQNQLYVNADRQRLHQVLLNLISNAIKYNHAGGTVSLSYEVQNQEKILICVRDTGIGITEEKLDQLFLPYVRLDEDHENIVEGTGLGLAFSKQLIEMMGGEIGVESTPEQGSNFLVELYLAVEPGVNYELVSQVSESLGLFMPEGTILYIEDYAANFELLKKALLDYPQVELIRANTGENGLAMAEQLPDLILLDLRLPDMHGHKVLLQLKQNEQTSNIPVVVLSADAIQRQIDILIDAGATAYVTKPYKMKEMLENIQQWMS